MRGIQPVLDLLAGCWTRFQQASLRPLAPAELVLKLAIRREDIRRRGGE